MSRKQLVWARKTIDPTLAAVLAEIHKSAQRPDKGFLTREQWTAKWKLKSMGQAYVYIQKAVDAGILVQRDYRIISKGRLLKMAHFGPPPKNKRS